MLKFHFTIAASFLLFIISLACEAKKKSFVFQDLSSYKNLEVLNPDILMTPASISKVISASAYLELLSEKKIETVLKVSSAESLSDGRIDQGLWIVGGGDPLFTTENMRSLVAEIKFYGIQSIENIYIDNTLFDSKWSDAVAKKSQRAYAAPISALSYNWNSVAIGAWASRDKKKRVIKSRPDSPYFKVIPKKMSVSAAKSKLAVTLAPTAETSSLNIVVSGKIQAGGPIKEVYRSIDDPEKRFYFDLVNLLAEASISVSGNFQIQKAPSSSKKWFSMEAPPVSEMVFKMMKYSNNFITDMLSLHLDTAPFKNYQRGVLKIKQHHESNGNALGSFVSASGLSSKNKLSCNQVLKILIRSAKNHLWGPEFLTSLPKSGLDGTLEKRFLNLPKGAVRAKTGMLTGVRSLTGFIRTKKGNNIAFCMMTNGPGKTQYRDQDEIDRKISQVYNKY